MTDLNIQIRQEFLYLYNNMWVADYPKPAWLDDPDNQEKLARFKKDPGDKKYDLVLKFDDYKAMRMEASGGGS